MCGAGCHSISPLLLQYINAETYHDKPVLVHRMTGIFFGSCTNHCQASLLQLKFYDDLKEEINGEQVDDGHRLTYVDYLSFGTIIFRPSVQFTSGTAGVIKLKPVGVVCLAARKVFKFTNLHISIYYLA